MADLVNYAHPRRVVTPPVPVFVADAKVEVGGPAALGENALCLAASRGEAAVETDLHQLAVARLSGDHLRARLGRRRQGLLDIDMLAGRQRLAGQRYLEILLRRDDDEVDGRIRQQVLETFRHPPHAVFARGRFRRGAIHVTDGLQVEVRRPGEIRQMLGAGDAATTDEGRIDPGLRQRGRAHGEPVAVCGTAGKRRKHIPRRRANIRRRIPSHQSGLTAKNAESAKDRTFRNHEWTRTDTNSPEFWR